MSWDNYHTHNRYCDGKEELEDYIIKAKELNIKTLGISSHAPVPFDAWWTMPNEKLSEYLSELQVLKQKYNDKNFTLLSSLEVDFIPGIFGPANPKIISANLDYILGSVHYTDIFNSGNRWTIDSDGKEFKKGVKEIFSGNYLKAVSRYFMLQMEMIDTEPPHIIGHCDKIRKHNENSLYFDENSKTYLSLVYDLLKFCSEKGVIVEINTKYLSYGFLFPDNKHFKWMKENKIPLTINSDAHHPNNLTYGFKEVSEMIMAAGFSEVWQWDGKQFAPAAIVQKRK